MLFSIIFFLPLVSAITFGAVPSNFTSGGSATFTWTSDSTDPSAFTLELVNVAFHNTFALANNVQTSDGSISPVIPIVPVGDGYTIEAVNIGNVNQVYGTSNSFSIGATVSSSTSGTSSSISTPSGSSSISTSTTGSGVKLTSTNPSVSTGTSSGASSSASPSSFNGNGALGSNVGSGIIGSIAAAVVGVIAGAVFV